MVMWVICEPQFVDISVRLLDVDEIFNRFSFLVIFMHLLNLPNKDAVEKSAWEQFEAQKQA